MTVLAEAMLLAVAVAPLLFIARSVSSPARPALGWLFLGLLALDVALTALPVPLGLNPEGASWNWTGKVLSLAWAAAFVWLGPLGADEVGLRLRQRAGSVAPALALTFVLVTATALLAGGLQPDAEALAYQATVPGLAEEFAYRGVFLALLDRSFETSPFLGAPVGWGVFITSVAFGLWHGVSLSGGFAFAIAPFVITFIGGLAFAWLRARTGSLLFPVAAHNAANLAVYIPL